MHPWIIGNWKKNPATLSEVDELTTLIKAGYIQRKANGIYTADNQPNIMLVPSALHLVPVSHIVAELDIVVGCQDVSEKGATTGAFTGDCSAQQMVNAGISWTLIGHSERREYYRENEAVLVAKMGHALEQGLGVIYCVGETLEARETNKTIAVIQEQLNVIANISQLSKYADKIMIAYEPIWAIGTGKVPTTEDVELVNKEICLYLSGMEPSLADTPILYGGSVKPDNAEQFASSLWVHGALIGGAALNTEDFLSIADTFTKVKARQN